MKTTKRSTPLGKVNANSSKTHRATDRAVPPGKAGKDPQFDAGL